jgi:hypothetical protein
MTTKQIYKVYSCPYCSKEYDKHIDAAECAEDCLLRAIDEVEVKEIHGYVCDICKTGYETNSRAVDCEKRCKELKFRLASQHPAQSKLL